ncbi:class I SAM-dependent methyltransferase [Caldovatus aquaticus]|uniref:Methyltransferase domain-containing protein n=1 Tax=Caldovatus aquaticus TaxID=2865671 RepID=A0ABS7F6C2_9PROT|nr:class I SAM-dependent methyltransferase [Caldovatus aquaticus]MBW8271170.1 methyltransferase domain-containing protein [Caldovatus aquaticus]
MADSTERQVAEHYAARGGALERAILEALAAAGADPDRLAPADLAPVDEFHIGGRQATMDLAAQLDLRPGMHLLDVGSGLGGASRYFAQDHGCRVTGIDLTEEFVRVAETLARRTGLADRVSYRWGSALSLPFAPASFDGATMLHVGMNIADKRTLFAEVRRVLRPGGVFAIYDVMREAAVSEEPRFPLPWAADAGASFLETAADYRRLLEAAGFAVRAERGRRDFAIAFFRRLRAETVRRGGPPPLGLHLVMGPAAQQKIANVADALERGLIVPTEIVCRAA